MTHCCILEDHSRTGLIDDHNFTLCLRVTIQATEDSPTITAGRNQRLMAVWVRTPNLTAASITRGGNIEKLGSGWTVKTAIDMERVATKESRVKTTMALI
mmetsp:Transcript_38644/g.52391  ORF Transcript_38644/g.52391 Transcript_38644/m.52391 type:complete len:100 (+) Transcript_38644:105-404(+)